MEPQAEKGVRKELIYTCTRDRKRTWDMLWWGQ